MRVDTLILCFQLIACVSCDNENNHNNGSQNQTKSHSSTTYENQRQKDEEIWREYKRVTHLNKDTVPYRNCFVIIKGNKMSYNREGKELYTDSIFLDKKYVAKTYRFKNHTGDLMIITGERDKELLIKRHSFDGDYEYFRKD